MKHLFFFLIFLASFKSNTQELVQNGSFELFTNCPPQNVVGQLEMAIGWTNPSVENSTQHSAHVSPDYFNTCNTSWLGVPSNLSGEQMPFSGNAYAGIVVYTDTTVVSKNFREYLQNELISPLESGQCYQFSLYVSLGDNVRYRTSDLQVYFSDTLISEIDSYEPLPFSPQLILTGGTPSKVNWISLTGDFIASGDEKFILIGNFKNDSQTIATIVGSSNSEPTSYLYIDEVSLKACSGLSNSAIFENTCVIYPNPSKNKISIESNFSIKSIQLQDVIGKTYPIDDTNLKNILVAHLPAGMYLLKIETQAGIQQMKFLKED
jgi:hypothetical protein